MDTRGRRVRTTGVAVALALLVGACSEPGEAPSPSSAVTPTSSGGSGTTPSRGTASEPETVAGDLDVPWDIAFLPGGDALVTLRDRARILRVTQEGAVTRLGTVPGVEADGEGGLLGLAPSPTFARDRLLYVYTTTDEDNRVLRLRLEDGGLGDPEAILTGIPKAGVHNGGRIAFGPDDRLYVATGDSGDGSAAQDPRSLGGKILRITPEGDPAPGNPEPDSPVWTLGHRNVQGLAWSEDGTMWASEFGQDTWDELNVITKGANYGWPEVEGEGGEEGFVDPVAQWSTAEASPSGIAVGPDGDVFLAALRGESLWRVPVRSTGEDVRVGTPQRLLEGEYGRLREVELAPDGSLWVLTNNTFRGSPREGDDRIIRLVPRSGR